MRENKNTYNTRTVQQRKQTSGRLCQVSHQVNCFNLISQRMTRSTKRHNRLKTNQYRIVSDGQNGDYCISLIVKEMPKSGVPIQFTRSKTIEETLARRSGNIVISGRSGPFSVLLTT